VASGVPLAREIQRVAATRPETNLFILGNHGVVACGECCEEAESILAELEGRVATCPRTIAKPDHKMLERVRALGSWRVPDCEVIHSLGTDLPSGKIVREGVLYPCQAVFLGARLAMVNPSRSASELKGQMDQLDGSCPLVVVENSGVLIDTNIRAAELATARGLAEVLRRIEPRAPIRYLTKFEVGGLLGAESDHYRKSAENGALHSLNEEVRQHSFR
jgi:hypothetical protein